MQPMYGSETLEAGLRNETVLRPLAIDVDPLVDGDALLLGQWRLRYCYINMADGTCICRQSRLFGTL